VEPGRFIFFNPRVLMTRVRYIKSAAGRIRRGEQTASKKFAIVDAGMNDLIRPALYQSYHEIVPVVEPGTLADEGQMTTKEKRSASRQDSSKSKSKDESERKSWEKMDIVGPVCESGDFFALDREMPELHEGDLLAIMSAGAYGFVMASNYNSRPLPAEVLIRGNRCALIRKRQMWEDLVRDEIGMTPR
ncbi:MAG: diaminopimelate decarboxylase family protein, partial [Chthoniobacterales bacterium]